MKINGLRRAKNIWRSRLNNLKNWDIGESIHLLQDLFLTIRPELFQFIWTGSGKIILILLISNISK